jgi:predicted nucleic acid-binding protein
MSSTPSVVLDTNAVLDWLVFRDPAAAGWGLAIETGRLRWLASPAMRREFDQVLSRPALAGWAPPAEAMAGAWARHAVLAEAEPPPGPLRCTDPDDQVFIDLALQHRATWLLTRDRALLVLAKRALPWGVTVLTPSVWQASQGVLAPTNLNLKA